MVTSRFPALTVTPGDAVVPRRIVALSIVGYWSFYFLISTLRVMVEAEAGQWLMLLARAAVTAASIAATASLYAVLKRTTGRSIASDVGRAVLASVPASAVYGVVSWSTFELMLPALRATAAAGASGGNVVVGTALRPELSPLAGIVETSLNGLFFFVGWCALYLALNHASRTRSLETAAARLQAVAQAAELRALRYQINPHFLFNTLNSLSSLVLSGDNPAAERMIGGLAAFLRTSLAEDISQDVTLAEEIDLQKLYLYIETQRFRERVRVSINLPPPLASARVPGLILQPLVENAIKHGVAKLRRPVTIRIAATDLGERMRLSVDDDGPGAPMMSPSGLGLANVRDRIAARFGSDGEMNWMAGASGGFSVELIIPLIRDDDDD